MLHRDIAGVPARGFRHAGEVALLFAILVAFLSQDVSRTVYAQSETEPLEFSDSESWILQRVAAGQLADLSATDYPGSQDRTLSSEFLKYLLTDDAVIAGPKGIRVSNGIVNEALDLELATFHRDTQLIGFHFLGNVDMRESVFLKGVSFALSTFDGALDFSRVKVFNSVFINEAKFNSSVNFDFAVIDGNLEADHSRFINKADERFIPGEDSLACDFDLVEISEPVTAGFSRLRVDGLASFYKAIFSGRAIFVLAEFGNSLDLEQAMFINQEEAAEFNGMKVGGSLLMPKTVFRGPVDFDLTDIALNLRAHNTAFGGNRWFDDRDRSVGFSRMKIGGTAYLDVECFAKTISLDGMSYGSINAGGEEEEAVLKSLLQLVGQSEYRTNVYANLEQFFKSQGQINSAEKVLIERKRRERREILGGIDKAGSYIMDFLVLYGLSPERALIPSLIVLISGWFWFRKADWMQLQNPGGNSPTYGLSESIWYGLDLFLPFIDLQTAKVWTPKEKEAEWARGRRAWMRIQTIAGWILIPIGLLALTGLFE